MSAPENPMQQEMNASGKEPFHPAEYYLIGGSLLAGALFLGLIYFLIN